MRYSSVINNTRRYEKKRIQVDSELRLNGWRRLFWLAYPSDNVLLLMLAVSVGVMTGGGVWLFREGIDFFQQTYQQGFLNGLLRGIGPAGIVVMLALAGLIVGLLMDRLIGEERHHGVAGIMEAVALTGGRLRYRRMPIKAALASFSLGAGASVGPEDPSVQIGASLGSMLGQRLRLTDERVRLLVAAGAAGGIAAAFRAPIAGVFFALEIILGDFSTGSFGVVVLTAVISSVVTQVIEAHSAIFTVSDAIGPELGIANYSLGGLQEIPLYIVLGILVAPVSALFIRLLYWQHDLWHHIKLSRPVKTMLAGCVVGGIAVFLPQIMGTGRDTMNALLNQNGADFALGLLLLLAFGKMLATTISLGGGFAGGMFAPSLFVGAAFGRAFGVFLMLAFPGALSANPAAFAIAGMAAAMTGVIRAPITAVLLLFELTNDYNLILPIMLTTAVCLLVVERIAPHGIYQLGLARKGIRLTKGHTDLLQTVTVGEVMLTDVATIPATLPAAQVQSELDRPNTHGVLVTDSDGLLYGVVTQEDIARARRAGTLDNQTAGDICTKDVITVTPDVPISNAIRIASDRDLGHLPVVASHNSRRLLGLVRRRDLVKAYNLASQRQAENLQRVEEVRLTTYSRAHIVELRIQPHSPVADHLIRDIQWPPGSVVATIRRHGQLIVPRGDTPLRPDDLLLVVTTAERENELRRLIATTNGSMKETNGGS
jgi:CIC family chloride channel protein